MVYVVEKIIFCGNVHKKIYPCKSYSYAEILISKLNDNGKNHGSLYIEII